MAPTPKGDIVELNIPTWIASLAYWNGVCRRIVFIIETRWQGTTIHHIIIPAIKQFGAVDLFAFNNLG